jgi:hypothetical protein
MVREYALMVREYALMVRECAAVKTANGHRIG